MQVDVLVAQEFVDRLLEVINIGIEGVLLHFHGVQLLLGIPIQDFRALSNSVLDVFGAFEHHPAFIDILRGQRILEFLQNRISLGALIDFLLNFFNFTGDLVHIFSEGGQFFDILGGFSQFVQNLEDIGVDVIVLLDYAAGNHIFEVLDHLFLFV